MDMGNRSEPKLHASNRSRAGRGFDSWPVTRSGKWPICPKPFQVIPLGLRRHKLSYRHQHVMPSADGGRLAFMYHSVHEHRQSWTVTGATQKPSGEKRHRQREASRQREPAHYSAIKLGIVTSNQWPTSGCRSLRRKAKPMRESPKNEPVVPVPGASAAAALSWKVAKTSTPPSVPTKTDAPSALMGNWLEEGKSLITRGNTSCNGSN